MLIWWFFFAISCCHVALLNNSVRFTSSGDRFSFSCSKATLTAQVSVYVQVGASKLSPSLARCAWLPELVAVCTPVSNSEIIFIQLPPNSSQVLKFCECHVKLVLVCTSAAEWPWKSVWSDLHHEAQPQERGSRTSVVPVLVLGRILVSLFTEWTLQHQSPLLGGQIAGLKGDVTISQFLAITNIFIPHHLPLFLIKCLISYYLLPNNDFWLCRIPQTTFPQHVGLWSPPQDKTPTYPLGCKVISLPSSLCNSFLCTLNLGGHRGSDSILCPCIQCGLYLDFNQWVNVGKWQQNCHIQRGFTVNIFAYFLTNYRI